MEWMDGDIAREHDQKKPFMNSLTWFVVWDLLRLWMKEMIRKRLESHVIPEQDKESKEDESWI